MYRGRDYYKHYHVIFNDTHGGCKVGMMPLDLVLEDEMGDLWHPEPTESQRLIDEVYKQGIQFTMELANGYPVYVHHVGDITHGTKHPDSELVSTRMSDHVLIGEGNMIPWLEHDNVKYLGLYTGTGSHEFGQGSSTIVVANMLRRDARWKDKDIRTVSHALVKKGGLYFDMAHHGPGPGIRKWLKGNVLRLYVKDIQMRAVAQGAVVPDVITRAHFHRYVPETVVYRANGKTYTTYAFIVPSFSFITDYSRKVAKSPSHVTLGFIVIEVIRGVITRVFDEPPLIQTFDLRKEIDLDADREPQEQDIGRGDGNGGNEEEAGS